jgi:hypothetical protein
VGPILIAERSADTVAAFFGACAGIIMGNSQQPSLFAVTT